MGCPRQEYWSGLPFPSLVDIPHPGTEPSSPAPAGEFFTTAPPGKPMPLRYKTPNPPAEPPRRGLAATSTLDLPEGPTEQWPQSGIPRDRPGNDTQSLFQGPGVWIVSCDGGQAKIAGRLPAPVTDSTFAPGCLGGWGQGMTGPRVRGGGRRAQRREPGFS